MCLVKYNCSWVATFIHKINETHPPAYLQDLIFTLVGIYNYYTQYTQAKVGIKSCRRVGGCVSLCMDVAAIVFDQTHVISYR